MVLDVNSGSVHVVDDVTYDVLSLLDQGKQEEEIQEALKDRYPAQEIHDAAQECQELKEAGMLKETMEEVMERIVSYMQHHVQGQLRTEAIVFSSVYGVLGESAGAKELIGQFQKPDQ